MATWWRLELDARLTPIHFSLPAVLRRRAVHLHHLQIPDPARLTPCKSL